MQRPSNMDCHRQFFILDSNRMRLEAVVLAGLISALACDGLQAASPATDLAPMLEPLLAQRHVPGMVALVIQGDHVIAHGAVGVRRSGFSERVTSGDAFHLGSCTKAMTGTITAMLVEEGKLRWDSTLSEIFGDTIKDIHPDWRSVTLRQVLAHRAGFPDGNIPTQVLDEATAAGEKSVTRQRQLVVARELARKPAIPPGTKWAYSNVDYIVAGAALEKVTGTPWETLMSERIFKPLGIVTGGFGPPGTPGKLDAPWGHDRHGNPVAPGDSRADNPPYYGPAAGVSMSVGDWAKFIGLHLRGDAANPNRQFYLLNAKTFAELHRWTPEDFYNAGLAFGTLDVARGARPGDRGVVFGHAGSNGRWYSKVLGAPEIDLAALVACNQGGSEAERLVEEVALRLLTNFAPQQRRPPG